MTDKSELLHLSKSGGSLRTPSRAQSSLIKRGRNKAAKLGMDKGKDGLSRQISSQKAGEGELEDGDLELARGVLYYHGKGVSQDFDRAAMWFRKAADKGIAAAQYYLGLQYYDGLGVRQSYVRAAAWYQMAAKQGYAPAPNNFGLLYELGDGVPRDLSLAAKWFRKAAEQGLASAQAWVGESYYYGLGVSRNYVEAYFWFYLATMDGAQTNLEKYSVGRDAASSKLTQAQRLDVQERARLWTTIHSPQG